MGSLIRSITQAGDARIGVNTFDIAPPASAVGALSKKVGIVMHLGWGDQNLVTEITSFAQFRSLFYPEAFGDIDTDTYPAMKALLGKRFPGPFYVCRINPTGTPDVATVYSYTVSGGAFVGTAKYTGTLGNAISVTWAAATDADSAHRNLTISIGTTYSVTYENVTLTSVLSLGNPYITWTASSSPSALPAAAASPSSTTAGVDGVAVAGDYVGSSSSSVGIRKFYAGNVNVDSLFVAECPSAILNAVNIGLVAYADDAGKNGEVYLCSVASQTASAAATYAASYRSGTSKVVYTWPRLIGPNTFDATFPDVTVDGNAFAAVMGAAVDPWMSPEGKTSARYLTWVTDLETNDSPDGTIDTLADAGVSSFYNEDTLGVIMIPAVTTNITSGQENLQRSRYRDYVNSNLSAIAIQYLGLPTDVDLTGQTLGETSGSLVGAITAFLQAEKDKRHIAAYSVDPFGSNTQDDIDAGDFTVAVAVDLFAPMRRIVLKTTIGSTVQISSS